MLRQLTQFWRFAILFAATLSCPGAAQAGVCGVSSYACCPVPACATASCYTACRVTTQTCMQTVCETVWEPEEYQTKRTVYENVWDEVQTTCYRQVTETAYRDEQYTVNRAVTETVMREEQWTVQRPVVERQYRDCVRTVQRPVWQDCERQTCYTVLKPVTETCEQECRQTVMKCVTETVNQERCWTVLRPEVRTQTVQRTVGEWQVQSQTVPGPVVPRLVFGPWGPQLCPVQCLGVGQDIFQTSVLVKKQFRLGRQAERNQSDFRCYHGFRKSHGQES